MYTYKKCIKCLGYNGTSMKMCNKCRKAARKYVKKMYGPTVKIPSKKKIKKYVKKTYGPTVKIPSKKKIKKYVKKTYGPTR